MQDGLEEAERGETDDRKKLKCFSNTKAYSILAPFSEMRSLFPQLLWVLPADSSVVSPHWRFLQPKGISLPNTRPPSKGVLRLIFLFPLGRFLKDHLIYYDYIGAWSLSPSNPDALSSLPQVIWRAPRYFSCTLISLESTSHEPNCQTFSLLFLFIEL